ncbi:MAG: SRPBCC family protein, partial [Pseudomonadota bacterium]
MNFRHEIEIDADRDAVWRAFNDPDNRPRWQAGFERVELLSGEAGHPGAVIRITLRQGGRTRQVIEEVTER